MKYRPLPAFGLLALLAPVIAGFVISSTAQQTRVPARGAVSRTHVPHLGALPAPGRSPAAQSPAGTEAEIPGAAPAAFTGPKYFVGPVTSPTTTFPEAEEHIAVFPLNSLSMVASISDFSRTVRGIQGVNTTKFASSTNNGVTWTEGFVPIAADGRIVTSDGLEWDANSDPVVAIDKAGNVYLSNLYINFISQSNDGLYVSVGTVGSTGLTVHSTNAVATNSPSSSNFEDKNWVAVDNSKNAATTGSVYSCWTRFTSTSDFILVSRSVNHGLTWSAPVQVSDPALDGAVQGCQVAVGPNGSVYVAYEGFFLDNSGNDVIRRQYVTKSIDGGQTFGAPVAATPFFNELTFPSTYRKNTFPALAVSPQNGNVILVYSANIGHAGGEIQFTQSADGGATFSTAITINDVSFGQQFFPAVAVEISGRIHASWFDTRNAPGGSAAAYDIYATFSNDGVNFSPNSRVTKKSITMPNGPNNPNFIGDYSGIAAGGGFAHPVWNNGGFVDNSVLQTARLAVPR